MGSRLIHLFTCLVIMIYPFWGESVVSKSPVLFQIKNMVVEFRPESSWTLGKATWKGFNFWTGYGHSQIVINQKKKLPHHKDPFVGSGHHTESNIELNILIDDQPIQLDSLTAKMFAEKSISIIKTSDFEHYASLKSHIRIYPDRIEESYEMKIRETDNLNFIYVMFMGHNNLNLWKTQSKDGQFIKTKGKNTHFDLPKTELPDSTFQVYNQEFSVERVYDCDELPLWKMMPYQRKHDNKLYLQTLEPFQKKLYHFGVKTMIRDIQNN